MCDKGYQLKQSSNNRLVCREDGSWRSSISNEFPQCQEKVSYYCTVQYSTVQCTTLHYTTQYSTVQYSKV